MLCSESIGVMRGVLADGGCGVKNLLEAWRPWGRLVDLCSRAMRKSTVSMPRKPPQQPPGNYCCIVAYGYPKKADGGCGAKNLLEAFVWPI